MNSEIITRTPTIAKAVIAKPNLNGTESWCLAFLGSQTPQQTNISTAVIINSIETAWVGEMAAFGIVVHNPGPVAFSGLKICWINIFSFMNEKVKLNQI